MPLAEPLPTSPSLQWRISSVATFAFAGLLSKAFLKLACTTNVDGFDAFIKLLDARQPIHARSRGLVTVSNHVSVLDDPLMWGLLPLRYLFSPDNMRWSLGSYDICFKNRPTATFFTLGQTLPTHRLAYSVHGGPFQPTMTQFIRLLSDGPFPSVPPYPQPIVAASLPTSEPVDPFSFPSSGFTYTTTGEDKYPAPSAYASRRHAWVHIFPEGKTHQHPIYAMRYFKWGVARLILESEPCPDVVPIWIDGFDRVMPEERGWPRWFPRWRKGVNVAFGECVDQETWTPFRERWKRLKERYGNADDEVGIVNRELQNAPDAVALRMEVASEVRRYLLKLRRDRGFPDEDPKASFAETWRKEGGKSEGRMDDGSRVRDT